MVVFITRVGEKIYALPCELKFPWTLQVSHMCDTLEIFYSSFSYVLKNLVFLLCIVDYLKWTINTGSFKKI